MTELATNYGISIPILGGRQNMTKKCIFKNGRLYDDFTKCKVIHFTLFRTLNEYIPFK
jgi:hypothetical protein